MGSSDDVYTFWFGVPATTADELRQAMRRWYLGGPDMDRAIADRFAGDVERALAGELAAWADTPRGRLALVLVLDQLTRNLFRDTPRAYAGDPEAQRLAVEAADRGLDADLTPVERNFLIMPLVHAEDLALQERAVAMMDRLVAEAPPALREVHAMGIEQSRKYRDVIARFGRFPHRNDVLGRPSTPDELAFLATWEATKRPRGA